MYKLGIVAIAFFSLATTVFADDVTTRVTETTSKNSEGEVSSTTTVSTTKQTVTDDDRIIDGAIKEKFAKSTTLTGTDLTAVSENSIVTLSGTVTTQSQADEAIAIAKKTNGVGNVISEITIKTKPKP